MAERNHIKLRKCEHCGEVIKGKASKLMEHYKGHGNLIKLAAERALMEKLQEAMLATPIPGNETIVMASEKVLNAEGD